MKYLNLLIIILLIWACEAPAQIDYYEVSWDLNSDGITKEYLIFIAFTYDSTDIPFNDSLFTFPDSQWTQFLIGYYQHDSIAATGADRGIIEYYIQRDPANPDSAREYIGLAVFARSPDGWYSSRATAGPIHVPTYLEPEQVAGIRIERKLKWQ